MKLIEPKIRVPIELLFNSITYGIDVDIDIRLRLLSGLRLLIRNQVPVIVMECR